MAWRWRWLKPTSFVDQPLGMHPAQRVTADIERAGVVADDHGVAQVSVTRHAAP